MPITTHTCAAIGCQHVIKTSFLMCVDHWRQVPAPLRREVLATYKASRARWNPEEQGAVQRTVAAAQAYRQAVQAAVDAVQRKQMTTRERRDAQTRPMF